MTTIKERLDILKAGDVISEEASTIAEEAVQRLSAHTQKTLPQNKVEMLVTHLASALTRMSRGESVDGPPEELFSEIEKSEQIDLANREINWLKSNWGDEIPKSEIAFLKMHYVSIFKEMK
ncbi:PRD domain-containing protein [Anaerobacillus sp. 1_MG-2023]|uniref:PRD domain-containing protein n=1 Tax=Anaerobacillus sp. 1_MG-2023 TaxID=3062655 RepID=UPI0026E37448|nr:PRD domain-containing protein [Anaerobacillus sp. 1_MG-2023]MDO6657717.1 PRD domain-containing protein [Anaerobacillus sp. 1_MG-2023]